MASSGSNALAPARVMPGTTPARPATGVQACTRKALRCSATRATA